jgi:hypothetical protein
MEKIGSEKIRENLQINTLKGKLTNNIARWQGYVLE